MNATQRNPVINIPVPTLSGRVELPLLPGRPLFILWRNGTGKSALVSLITRVIGRDVIYLPGSRPSYFDSESLNMTPAGRQGFNNSWQHYNSSISRWKPPAGTSANEKAVVDLVQSETSFKVDAANQIRIEGSGSSAIARLQHDPSPLDQLNDVLAQANFHIRLSVRDGSVWAVSGDQRYSYARMSDGERSALILLAEVVTAPVGSIFVIDEPERHLHSAIAVSLLRSALEMRRDCSFVISTHQLELPLEFDDVSFALVRSCRWEHDEPVCWDLNVVEQPDSIPEWLWVDLIGARQRILFVEGDAAKSLDQPLYSLLFPRVSVRSKASCTDVARAVRGLRDVADSHRAEVYGIIDGDGMSEEQIANYEADGIFPLSVFSVESLIYSAEAQKSVAILQSQLHGLSVEGLLKDARDQALASFNNEASIEHLATRRAVRQLRDLVLQAIPKQPEVIKASTALTIVVESPYQKEISLLRGMLAERKLARIIERYPIRESAIPEKVSKALQFPSKAAYERAVLRRVSNDSDLRASLLARLGGLPSLLG